VTRNRRRNQPRVPWVEVLGKKQESVSAKTAYDDLGPYDVSLRDVFVSDDPVAGKLATHTKAPGHKAIVRGPMADEKTERVFNVVGRKYRLITPETIVNLWDEHIGKPVTSIGALDHGERFFLATQLPTVKVPGDDKEGIDNTLVLVSPMNGREAIIGMLVPVRLVCMNGMVTMGDIKEAFTLKHYQNNLHQLPAWLAGVYQRNVANLGRMEQAWKKLASHKVTKAEERNALDVAFPLPVAMPDMDLESRQRFERRLESAKSHRELAREFFGGRAAGMENKANKGTAYGLYNSIVELIDWGAEKGEGAKMATVRSAAMGMAYKKKEQVLSHLVSISQ
jgi:hypothetical protein